MELPTFGQGIFTEYMPEDYVRLTRSRSRQAIQSEIPHTGESDPETDDENESSQPQSSQGSSWKSHSAHSNINERAAAYNRDHGKYRH